MADVTLRKVVKRYDDVEAVRGIDLDIADHEFVVLVGPSGCGKSTTLRMIAGLEDISAGDVKIDGAIVNRDASGIGSHRAGEDLNQCRFAGAVLSHQRVRLAGEQIEGHVLERADARVRFGNSSGLE